MKVKVIYGFADKHTKKFNKVGDILDIDKKRFDEIQSIGNFVEKVEKPAENKEKKD